MVVNKMDCGLETTFEVMVPELTAIVSPFSVNGIEVTQEGWQSEVQKEILPFTCCQAVRKAIGSKSFTLDGASCGSGRKHGHDRMCVWKQTTKRLDRGAHQSGRSEADTWFQSQWLGLVLQLCGRPIHSPRLCKVIASHLR